MRSINFLSKLFLILIFATIHSQCESIDNSNTTTSSSVKFSDETFPAFNKELIIDIEGDSIAGYAFIASGETVKETVILIAGYPGNDNNFDIAQEIRRKGKNVIHFNHRGAWGSQGKYTYSSCLEDIDKLIEYLSQGEIAKKLRIDLNNFILLGRSYGGGIALIAGSKHQLVKKIIAISSVNYGEIMEKYNNLHELSNFKKYMQKQVMIKTNIDDFLQEMLDNKKKFDIINYNNFLKNKKVLIVEDSNKNESWINKLENVEYTLMKSDHNFIDKRLELTQLIINWINK